MSRIELLHTGPGPRRRDLRRMRGRDYAFVAFVAALSVGGSAAFTLLMVGPDGGALFTATLIPLLVSVPVAVVLARQRAEITAVNAQLAELLRRDPLTGTLTRRAFLDALDRSLPEGGAMVVIDADRFKAINDTFGHPAGDAALRAISDRIGRTLPDSALFGRLGGEEFAVFLPAAPVAAARLQAEEMRRAVCVAPVRHDGQDITVSISLGVAWTPPATLEHAAPMARADAALYAAKEGGRNRVAVADSPPDAAAPPGRSLRLRG